MTIIVEASDIRCFDANNYDKKKKYRVYHDKENYYADAFIVGISDDLDALEKQKSKRFSRPSLICAKSASESSDTENKNTDRNNNNSKSKPVITNVQAVVNEKVALLMSQRKKSAQKLKRQNDSDEQDQLPTKQIKQECMKKTAMVSI
ncbi:hypothetical protein PV328_012062 [Microctonus aethiopoides]|uniref:Uncharacterized protein n=1 Tax=Microctonus aethiopoides TaxID=144406 RepID=A0AA39FH07_9HYME|nr:hypothetical protein PV328_012062 [Microctonus aethiopoides]